MSTKLESTHMCRACMKPDGILLSMYGDDMEQKNLPNKLADLADIQITEEDGLPTVLCPKCAYRTDAFYDFKIQVQRSQEKLREIFLDTTKQGPVTPELSSSPRIEFDNLEGDDEIYEIKDILTSTNYPSDPEEPADPATLDEEIKMTPVIDELESVEVFDEIFMPPAPEFSFDKRELISREEIPPELHEFLEPEDVGYTLLYIPSDEVDLNLREEETDAESYDKEFKNIRQINSSIQCQSSDEIRGDNSEELDSDTDSWVEQTGNLVGSLNDTIVRIKELKKETGSIEYQCSLCVKNYEKLTEVLSHTVEYHIPSTGPFFCVVCEKDCESHKDLRFHVKTHTGPNPYICFMCDKAYSTKRYLKRHMVCHTDFLRYRCAKCGKRFKIKSELEIHATTHLHGAPYSCSQCDRIFNHKGNYKRHLISHLDPQGLRLPKYPCNICGKRFLNNRTLQTHIRVHTGEKPFTCKICSRSFSQQGNLLNHMRIHSNPRSYTCEVCGKRFNQRATLKDHSLLHTGEKPYVCNICGNAFTFSAALRRHMWVHAGDKPLGCDICDARFVGRYDLNRHMKIHSDKPRPKRQRNSNRQTVNDMREANDITSINHAIPVIDSTFEQVLLTDNPGQSTQQEESEKENVDALFNLIQYD